MIVRKPELNISPHKYFGIKYYFPGVGGLGTKQIGKTAPETSYFPKNKKTISSLFLIEPGYTISASEEKTNYYLKISYYLL